MNDWVRTSGRLLPLIFLLGLPSLATAEDEVYPSRPIRVIVPFGAGGNSDTIARVIQRAISDHALLSQPLVIQNVPGAGGTIGSRRALHAEPDGYTLLFLHEGIITARFSGAASWSWRDFEPIAATGRNGGVIAVATDSPYHNLGDLLSAATEKPNTVTFATNIGAPAHFWAMRLEGESPGTQFRYVQAGGGSARFHSLKGGHVEATAFSVAEYLSYNDGTLRALSLMSETRDAALPGTPTALEQGIDLISSNLQCWWAPQGTSPEKLAIIQSALEKAMATPEFREFAQRQQIEPLFLSGASLKAELEKREAEISSVAPRAIAGLPDLPRALAVLALITGIGAICFRPYRLEQTPPVQDQDRPLLVRRTVTLLIATILFSAVLGYFSLPFYVPAFLFLVGAANLLMLPRKPDWRESITQAGFAALLAWGLPSIFESVFRISMP